MSAANTQVETTPAAASDLDKLDQRKFSSISGSPARSAVAADPRWLSGRERSEHPSRNHPRAASDLDKLDQR
ncbi:hypothetical protein A5777_10735 [Gordonia sp. 852002-10350_SCH5691597]|nr:hypothetical protein A5766_00515 [Gordonia sp. 852002-51296_SCH5728562-b]OBA72991.1 hypothetical protein A5777_10735 [Gordonia sp. 852002-10350_SCH5691597]